MGLGSLLAFGQCGSTEHLRFGPEVSGIRLCACHCLRLRYFAGAIAYAMHAVSTCCEYSIASQLAVRSSAWDFGMVLPNNPPLERSSEHVVYLRERKLLVVIADATSEWRVVSASERGDVVCLYLSTALCRLHLCQSTVCDTDGELRRTRRSERGERLKIIIKRTGYGHRITFVREDLRNARRGY